MTPETYQEYELDYYAEILATHPLFPSLQYARDIILFTQVSNDLSTTKAGKLLLKKYNITEKDKTKWAYGNVATDIYSS